MNKPYRPDLLPIKFKMEDIIEIISIETEARVKIERYNQMLDKCVIQKEILMIFSMDESIQSTRIEGTQTTYDEVMEAEITGKRKKDVQEVLNYFEALGLGAELLRTTPLSTRLILQLHSRILEDSSYIPPEPQNINQYMSNLERYMNNEIEDAMGPIARASIIHAQFETIHPFLDGNGRLGRILIILYLLDQDLIKTPSFFMSQELEKNKFKYYTLLNNLRKDEPQWKEWIIFFINASINQADYYIGKLEKVEKLYNELSSYAHKYGIRQDLIVYIFSRPVFTVKCVQEALGVSYNTARNNINKLMEGGNIYGDDKKRGRTYRFYELMDVIR